jgi:hypothetical protein
MIADLIGTMNKLEKTDKVVAYRRVLFPAPASRSKNISAKHSLEVQKTYVYHESTRVTPSLSILSMHCSRRTILQFHCVVRSKQSCDLSTGQGERASVELPIATGHLQHTVCLRNEMLGDDERFTRSTSLAVCFMTCFASFPSEWFKLNGTQA